MPEIRGSVFIRRPPQVVADYVTTPATWPEWYPLTRSVSGPVDRTPAPGVVWQERVRIGLFPFTFTWRTLEDDRPRRYRYQGSSNAGGLGTITYEFEAEGEGTRWSRTLTYRQDHWWTRLLDTLFLHGVIRRASDRALLNARDRLEAQRGSGPGG